MIDLFAVTTRGLEAISAEELAAQPGVAIRTVGYRRVAVRAVSPLSTLLDLRTIDDLFLDVATWQDIGPERAALAVLRAQSAWLDLRPALATCINVRAGATACSRATPPVFSITANFVGRRNYTSDEIKLACAASIEGRHRGWTYTPDDREADLNVRVFLEHTTAYVGVRVAREPLQNRPYKQEHVPGSLRPPVAAAMARLAGVGVDDRVLDPCCGAGTLLIEAAYRGAIATGGDTDPMTLAAARSNAASAGLPIALQCWDARALPFSCGATSYILTNPPWGRKVTIETDTGAFYAEIGREICRVLAPGGRAAILTWAPDWVRAWGMHPIRDIEISLYGRTPTVMLLGR